MRPEGSGTRYRRDIDGLRAVAVILVILYHLNHSWAPGGLVGVDIFFVISGFVVTSSVLASREMTPFGAMIQFWRRRILRIMPAVLLLVIVSIIMMAILWPPFPPAIYNTEFRTGISAIFGLANFYLYQESLDYFGAAQSSNPFVHMWSLGVEEQFYFAFAIVFIGGIALLRRREVRLAVSVAFMSLLGVASYCALLVTAQSNPSLSYYIIAFRFWEIAAGSVLAYADWGFPDTLRPKIAAWAVSLQILAVLLLIKAIWLDHPSGFPTEPISIATVSAVLLIVAGKHPAAPISRVLSMPIFVKIGLISYSLYLWHYPVLLFWHLNIGLDRAVQILPAVLVIIFAATFSYRMVELPLRYSKAPFAKVILPCLAGIVILIIGCTWLFQRRPGMLYIGSPQLWTSDWEPQGDYAYSQKGRIVGSACQIQNGLIPSDVPDRCFSTPETEAGGAAILLLAGDSHAYADWGMAEVGAEMNAFRFATLVYQSCAPGQDRSTRSRSCNAYWDGLPAIVRRTVRARDSVLVAFRWPDTEAETKRAEETIKTLIRAAGDRGAEVIVEAPLPTFDRAASLCTKEWYRSNYEGCYVDRSDVEKRRASVMTDLRAIEEGYGNVRVWDPLGLLCPTKACGQFRENKPIFRDTDHLSYYGSKWLGPVFARFVGQARQ